MEELKEKLLCALTNNAESISPSGTNYFYLDYRKSGIPNNISICKVVLYKEERYLTKKGNFLRGDIYSTQSVPTGEIEYFINYCEERVPITEEEYDNIMNLREKIRKERELKDLDKLCQK